MRILTIGDIHNPWCHPGYLAFCRDLRDRHKCDHVTFIGDIVDWHSISFHPPAPEAPGPTDEFKQTKAGVARWYRVFPDADVCIGNHDERIFRRAATVNIPEAFLKTYKELWDTPGWNWQRSFIHDDVYYFHGTGTGGVHPAYSSMQKQLMSVVQGHIHSASGIKWRANPRRRIFGMDVGCGVDDKAIAFAYGQNNQVRSILSAAVIIDGIPHLEVMPMGPGEKYHRSRFKKGS